MLRQRQIVTNDRQKRKGPGILFTMDQQYTSEFNKQATRVGESGLKVLFKYIELGIKAFFSIAQELFHSIIGK